MLKMSRLERIVKKIQRRIYDILLTKYGLLIILFSVVIIIASLINVGDSLIEYSIVRSKTNIQDKVQDEPIDIVYTWVNGSDLKHLEALKAFKLSQTNKLNEKFYKTIEFDHFVRSLRNLSSTLNTKNLTKLIDRWHESTRCYYKYCMQTSNLLVIQPKLNYDLKYRLLTRMKLEFASNSSFIYTQMSIDTIENKLSLLTFDFNIKKLLNLNELNNLNEIFSDMLGKDGFKIYLGYFTIDCFPSLNCVRKLNNTFIVKSMDTHVKLPTEGIIYRFDYHLNEQIDEYSLSSNIKKIKNEQSNEDSTHLIALKFKSNASMPENANLSFYETSLVWDLGSPFDEDMSPNRFQDNDELKYSLRSIEKYALAWIRNVYIVTNGQVPSWLNLSHPQIRLVIHEDIFLNKTRDLPTFSSPAIESHLHRIPGLSTHFLYFNDDVMLGSHIYREDFFTQSKGYKVYLAWSLPGCNSHCPQAWIKDGYCDKPCNTSECEYDGGDCLRHNGVPRQSALMSLQTSSFCSPGCLYTWLGDRFCDGPCNTKECGFDLGDCGLNLFNQLYQVKLFENNDVHFESQIPHNLTAFFLNFTLSGLNTESYSIENALIEKNDKIRAAVVINKYKIVSISLKYDQNFTFQTYKIHLQINSTVQNVNASRNLTVFLFESDKISEFTTMRAIFSTKTHDFYANNSQIKPLRLDKPHLNASFTFKNQYIDEIFKNYREYLNWTLYQGYITQKGLEYKLHYFAFKLKNTTTNSSDYLFDADVNLWQAYDDYLLNLYTSNTSNTIKFKKRKLQDTFANSLRHVNKLFNEIYGFMPRKVPAHMPHYINKQIMNELQNKFSSHFERTSVNRLRSKDDMQYSFSYFYYLMSEPRVLSMSEIFNDFDLNQDNVLSNREIWLFDLRIDAKNESLNDYIKNCTKRHDLIISRHEFLECNDVEKFIAENFWYKKSFKKYKHEIKDDEDIQFQMLSSIDFSKMQKELNAIMRQPKKFICINDNLDHLSSLGAQNMKLLLRNFYETLYPMKSSFENANISFEATSKFYLFNQTDFFNLNLLIAVLALSFIIVLLIYLKYFISKNRGRKYLIRKRRTEQLRRLSQRKDSSSDDNRNTVKKSLNKKTQFIL